MAVMLQQISKPRSGIIE